MKEWEDQVDGEGLRGPGWPTYRDMLNIARLGACAAKCGAGTQLHLGAAFEQREETTAPGDACYSAARKSVKGFGGGGLTAAAQPRQCQRR